MITEDNRHQRAEEIKLMNLRTHRAAQHLLNVPVNKDIPLRITCECGRPGCHALIALPFSKLERIRKEYPAHFIIDPDHFDAKNYTAHQQEPHYWVIAKSGK